VQGSEQRFDRRGRATVTDARIKPTSTILLQELGAGHVFPAVVTDVRQGSFTATGWLNGEFTYVIVG
jgi:hypothetical protein